MDLTHLFDTSALIEVPATVDDARRLATSIICIGELQAAVLLARSDEDRYDSLGTLVTAQSNFVTIDAHDDVAAAYGRLRAASGRMPSNDVWIAATAVARGLTLVTYDAKLAALPGVDTLLL